MDRRARRALRPATGRVFSSRNSASHAADALNMWARPAATTPSRYLDYWPNSPRQQCSAAVPTTPYNMIITSARRARGGPHKTTAKIDRRPETGRPSSSHIVATCHTTNSTECWDAMHRKIIHNHPTDALLCGWPRMTTAKMNVWSCRGSENLYMWER